MPTPTGTPDIVNNYDYSTTTVTLGPYADFDLTASTPTVNVGSTETMDIDGESVTIIVMGDYYIQDYQFNPVVGELWSGNAISAALWNPTIDEIPDWIVNKAQLEMGYAYLYDGYFTTGNNQPYKPEGVTRIGEVLGYDVYARSGETFRNSGNVIRVTASDYLTDDDPVSLRWAVCNIYRAVGQEMYNYALVQYRWKYMTSDGPVLDYAGSSAITSIRGAEWDHNTSPVAGFLTGNIDVDYNGDFNPLVLLAATRTDFSQYWDRASNDILSLNLSNNNISRIDFLTLVWELMYDYGEPVMTEQEQYMLLEAYGRKLPWDLNSYQLDAVRNLLCRGICDTDVLEWNWYEDINFEDACTVLMRVKDTGSRLTFKEFQLTTDLSLLQKGYYPVEVAPLGVELVDMEPVGSDVINSYYYDFYIRRSDNRALFVADANVNPNSGGSLPAVAPHIAPANSEWYKQLTGALYMGTDDYGYTHFRIPISYFVDNDTVYVNSANSGNDDPGQYIITLSPGQYGGVYVLHDSYVEYQSFDESALYNNPANIDYARYSRAVQTSANTTGTKNDTRPYTDWVVDIPRTCFAKWNDMTQSWDTLDESTWVYGSASRYDYTKNGPKMLDETLYTCLSSGGAQTTITMHDGFKDAAGNSKTVTATLDYRFSQGTSNSYFRIRVTCDDGLTRDDINTFLGYNSENVTKSSSLTNSTQGYMRRNNCTLLSVDYLQSSGHILSFTEQDVGLGKVYHLVVSDIDTRVQTDVWVSPDKCMVIYGQCVYFFEESRELVWTNVTGQKYIDTCIINGRTSSKVVDSYSSSSELGLTAIGGQGTGVSLYTQPLHYYGAGSCSNISVAEIGGREWVNTSATCINANYLAYYNTVTAEGGVFFLYAKTEGDADDSATWSKFSRLFGSMPVVGDTLYCYEAVLTPTGYNLANGTRDLDAVSVIASRCGTIFFQVGTVQPAYAMSKSATSVYVDEEQFYLFSPNYTADGTMVRLTYAGDHMRASKVEGVDTTNIVVEERVDLDTLRYGICGLPAIVSGVSVQWQGTGSNSKVVKCFLGSQYIDAPFNSDMLDNAYLLREAIPINGGSKTYYVGLRGYKWEDVDDAAQGLVRPSINVGQPNKITEWLTWLKDAQLSDAEDILTICIIASLQWIPRIFMFMFILLMALSMIANVKPWQQFCDSVVDPYKVLTAGRQTVHTIDLKKTVLYSLIALVMFGLFQNGLILEVIGWLARAVTGILNR